jgi:hypothetical protein
MFVQPDAVFAHTVGGVGFGTPTYGSEDFSMAIDRVSFSLFIGAKPGGVVRVYAAPVWSYAFGSVVYSQRVNRAILTPSEMGWELGLGYDYRGFTTDIRFETLFSDAGFTRFEFTDNSELHFYQRWAEVSVSVGYRIGNYAQKRRVVARYN